jgi:hypothetical protein
MQEMERIILNSDFAYYYCCVIIIISVLSQLKSMNCHLGKYALFHVYGYVCIPEQIVHPWG